jgi:hypothetical protein
VPLVVCGGPAAMSDDDVLAALLELNVKRAATG